MSPGPVEAVWISGAAEPHAGGPSTVLIALTALAVSLVAAAGLAWRYGAWLDDAKAPELAFRNLARRLGLRSDERELVRRLGLTAGVDRPAALLVSEHAFIQAAQSAATALPADDAARLRAIEQRLFR